MAKYRLRRCDTEMSVCELCKDREEDMPADRPLNKRDLWVLERVALYLEKSKLNSYVEMMGKPWRWFFLNLWGGIGRGIGMAIGFTLLGAVLFLVLQEIVMFSFNAVNSLSQAISPWEDS